METENKSKKVHSSGKRKSAVAKALIVSGNGKITYKGKLLNELQLFDRLKLEEPIRIAEKVLGKINFDVEMTVKGGGEKGQIDASRISLAKGIVKFTLSEKLKDAYLKYDRNLLVADVRRKEPNKPGDSKARAKRQKSFR
jgi:small subunit ribosomal protein S9